MVTEFMEFGRNLFLYDLLPYETGFYLCVIEQRTICTLNQKELNSYSSKIEVLSLLTPGIPL